MEKTDFLLTASGITKRFPGVLALSDVDFDLKPGEVHVLLGENGAGKSTFIKVLSGAYRADKGDLYLKGQKTAIQSPHHAMDLGIATCYQEFNLIPYLSVAENIFLGRFPMRKAHIIDKPKLHQDAKAILDSIGIDLDVTKIVNDLGVAEKQMVEIAKALSLKAKIYIMDEPTAVLSNRELDELFRVIRQLRKQGAGIIYISHRLEELPVIGDRVTVLRDGRKIGTQNIKNVGVDQLIEMMVGRALDKSPREKKAKVGKEVLRVEGLSRHKIFHNISLKVHAGEIVGIAGLVGSKRTEVVRAIFGADPVHAGKVYLHDQEVSIRSPRSAVRKGVSLLPEDRKKQGLVLISTIRDNVILPSLSSLCKACVISDNKASRTTESFIKKLGIKTPSMGQKAQNLSGGNQQKVVIAKWLASGCKVFLFDEPTRGIDVGAKAEVYSLMHEITEQGGAILMVSSELPEVLHMCDRVYVMNNGRIRAELDREEMSQEKILKYAMLESSPDGSDDPGHHERGEAC